MHAALIAAQLEKSWEGALLRVQACQVRLDGICAPAPDSTAAPDFTGLAEDLEAAWNAPGVTMRTSAACESLDCRHHRRRGGEGA